MRMQRIRQIISDAPKFGQSCKSVKNANNVDKSYDLSQNHTVVFCHGKSMTIHILIYAFSIEQ